MPTGFSHDSMLTRARTIADFQFGRGAGAALFPEGCEFTLSRTGRLRQVLFRGERLATLRAQDGRFTLSFAGALRLQAILPAPAARVTVATDVASFPSAGKNVFAKHVVAADPAIHAGDEVLVVDDGDRLLATGTAVLSGTEMLAFNYGGAVSVRQGVSAHVPGKGQSQEDEADDEQAGHGDAAYRGRTPH
ncbi:MAG: pseudouridine synthase [Methanomicrobiales archaeon]|nr:pseudouridine synthase [Methanomicrobiales archaeon]